MHAMTTRTREFQKEARQESRLRELNELLSPVEESLWAPGAAPARPTVFVVGAPRSGTTLLAEVLAQTGAFAYPTNFVARFWNAPALGMRIQAALGLAGDAPASSFASTYGTTTGWAGPHEFGYFWTRWLRFGETHKLSDDELARVDGAGLLRQLAAMEEAGERPLFFKNLACGLQAGFFARLLPRSVFVLCRRSHVHTMQSLVQARRRVLGDLNAWFSLRPAETPRLAGLPPYEQVAHQIRCVLADIEGALAELPAGRVLEVEYDDLCADPRGQAARVLAAVAALDGGSAAPEGWKARIPEAFQSTDRQALGGDEFAALREAAARVFGGAP
jgi:hypothetical protein